MVNNMTSDMTLYELIFEHFTFIPDILDCIIYNDKYYIEDDMFSFCKFMSDFSKYKVNEWTLDFVSSNKLALRVQLSNEQSN